MRAIPTVVLALPAMLALAGDPTHFAARIHDAGRYDGEYVVKDPGRTIKGREIDRYLVNDREAKRFGRKRVRVDILERGTGDRADAANEPVPER